MLTVKRLAIVQMLIIISLVLLCCNYYYRYTELLQFQTLEHNKPLPPAIDQKPTYNPAAGNALNLAESMIKESNITLFNDYKIIISRNKLMNIWIIDFIGLPESFDYQLSYTVTDDGLVKRIK